MFFFKYRFWRIWAIAFSSTVALDTLMPAFADIESQPLVWSDEFYQVVGDPATDSGWNSDDSLFAVSKLDTGINIYDQSMQAIDFIPIDAPGGVIGIKWNPVHPELIAVIAASLPTSEVQVWDVEDKIIVFSTEVPLNDFPDIDWKANGNELVIVGGYVGEVWNVFEENQAFELDRTGSLAEELLFEQVSWSASENLIATDGVGQQTILWSAATGEQADSIPYVGYLIWIPNGDQIAILDTTLRVYDVSLQQVTHSFPINGLPQEIIWRGHTLVSLSVVIDGNHYIQVIDTTTYQVITTIELSGQPLIALTSDGSMLTIVDNNGAIREVLPVREL